MIHRSMTGLASFGSAVLVATWLLGADPPATTIDKASTSLMRDKLKSSQTVLEGILTEDFRMIARGAREMKRISLAAEWSRSPDSVYEHYSGEFRRQCGKLEDLALRENLEGASFTYLHMTTVCINCHAHNRNKRSPVVVPETLDSERTRGVQQIPTEWPERNVHPEKTEDNRRHEDRS